MIRLSEHEYVYLVRLGSALTGVGPGYLYVEGDVSGFFLEHFIRLEKEMQKIAHAIESDVVDRNTKDPMLIWKDRLNMMVSICRTKHYRYEKLDALGLQRVRLRSFVLGCPFYAIEPGCEWLCTEGEFGFDLVRRRMILVCFGQVTEPLKKWLSDVEVRFRTVLPQWGADSDRMNDAVLQILDVIGTKFGLFACMLTSRDVEWLRERLPK